MLKVSDGRIFRKIPKCEKCVGGIPVFNIQKGTYKCAGYIDDDTWRMCNSKYSFEEIKREKWLENGIECQKI